MPFKIEFGGKKTAVLTQGLQSGFAVNRGIESRGFIGTGNLF